MAREHGDIGRTAGYALVADALRQRSTPPPEIVSTLVGRGMMDVDEGLSIFRNASSPGPRLEGLAALLAFVAEPRRSELLDELLDGIVTPTASRTGVGTGATPSLPLWPRAHIGVIRRLVALPGISGESVERIRGVATRTTSVYTAIEAELAVAALLPDERYQQVITQAWDVTVAVGRFRGRGEEQAMIAVAAANRGDPRYVDAALATILDVLRDSGQRMLGLAWSQRDDGEGLSRTGLFNCAAYAAPLGMLAPHLTHDRLVATVRELRQRADAQSALALAALVPIVGARSMATALDLVRELGPFGVLGMAAAAADGLADVPADAVADAARRIDDPDLRTLALMAVVPALAPERAAAEIRALLAGTDETPGPTSLRRSLLPGIPPLLRTLTAVVRDDLVRTCSDVGELTRSPEEISTVLGPVTDLWPTELLRRRLAELRSVAVGADVVSTMTRRVTASPPNGPAAPSLDAEAASTALDIAAAQDPARRVASVVLLAPVLDRDATARARNLLHHTDPVHLRMEPLVRLAEVDRDGGAALAAAIGQIPRVTGGLDRLRDVIDRMIALVRPVHAATLGPLVCAAVEDLDTPDIAVLLPIAAALGDGLATAHLEQVLLGLQTWFGAAEVPPTRTERNPTPPLMLPLGTAGPALVAGCARAGAWTTAGRLLALPEIADDTGIAAGAERLLVELYESPPPGSRARSDPEALALLRDIATTAGTRARRLRALTALLRRSSDGGDSCELAQLLDSPDLVLGVGAAADAVVVEAAVAGVAGWLALGRVGRAAEILQFLIADTVPYRMATGRQLTRAARAVQAAVDGHELSPGDRRDGERALTAYLGYVVRHHEDYTLQEAAGALLRDRVAGARTAGRDVDRRWLASLEQLADADEPAETILHELTVAALCDAAGASPAEEVQRCLTYLRAAFVRCRRHPEAPSSARVFIAAVEDVVSRLDTVDETAVDELTCLAAMLRLDLPHGLQLRFDSVDAAPTVARVRGIAGVTPLDVFELRRRLAARQPIPPPPAPVPGSRSIWSRWRRR